MTNGSGPAVFHDRRRAERVQDAAALRIVRLQDKPAAGESAATDLSSQSADVTQAVPTHKCSISSVGLAFADDALLQPGELISVELTLFPSRRVIPVDARVVAANDSPEISNGDKPTYRIEFQSIADEDRDFIDDHVASLSRQRPELD